MSDKHYPIRTWPGWLTIFACSLTLYVATASRGTQWQDSGYFILRAVTGEEPVNPLGLALTHPLHYWLSRAAVQFPWVEPAFAVTLISSLAAAVAVANLFGGVMALTGNRAAAGLSAASLALANTFWQLATIAETYTITAALLTAECWCLIVFLKSAIEDVRSPVHVADATMPRSARPPWAFLGMWFLNGLSLANHNLALLTIPALLVATIWGWKRRVVGIGFIVLGLAVWLAAASPYLGLIAQESVQSGEWVNTLRSALFGRTYGEEVLNLSMGWDGLLISTGFVLLNFPNLLLPAAVFGIGAALRSKNRRWLYGPLFLGLVVHVIFAIRYPVSDQHFFFIPTYIFLALFAGLGFARWISTPAADGGVHLHSVRWRRISLAAAFLGLTPVAYAFTPALARRWDALGYVERNKPYRDDYAYLFLPWSVAETSADRMSREALELAGVEGCIIVEDRMAEFAVRYRARVEGRSKVWVVREIEPAALPNLETMIQGGYRIVLVPRNKDQPITHPIVGSWKRIGDLYVLSPEP